MTRVSFSEVDDDDVKRFAINKVGTYQIHPSPDQHFSYNTWKANKQAVFSAPI